MRERAVHDVHECRSSIGAVTNLKQKNGQNGHPFAIGDAGRYVLIGVGGYENGDCNAIAAAPAEHRYLHGWRVGIPGSESASGPDFCSKGPIVDVGATERVQVALETTLPGSQDAFAALAESEER